MDILPALRIASADRLDRGLIVTFDDGTCAIFPPALLVANLRYAEQVEATPWGPDEE